MLERNVHTYVAWQLSKFSYKGTWMVYWKYRPVGFLSLEQLNWQFLLAIYTPCMYFCMMHLLFNDEVITSYRKLAPFLLNYASATCRWIGEQMLVSRESEYLPFYPELLFVYTVSKTAWQRSANFTVHSHLAVITFRKLHSFFFVTTMHL
jgi:hypothetical protein